MSFIDLIENEVKVEDFPEGTIWRKIADKHGVEPVLTFSKEFPKGEQKFYVPT